MSATVESLFDEYARRYIAGDVKGVASLCLCPFLAVRRGEPIHMPDRGAVLDHFAAAIGAYPSVFATVHWNALDADGQVVRDTWTSYHLLATPDGLRFLSYTNHF